MSSGLQDSPCFAIARCAVGKEHRAELATNEIEGRIFKRQRQRIRLAPFDPSVGRLSRCGVVDHRLVEVGCDRLAGVSEASQVNYFLGPSTLLSTIFRASAKASAGVENGIVAANLSPSSSYIVTMKPASRVRSRR